MNLRLSTRIAIALVALVAIPAFAFAAEFRTGDQPSLGSGETLTDDLYIFGGSVSSAGVVRGDIIAGGGTVVVSGDVTGDAMLSGGTVTVLGDVSDDVRIGGGTITLNGGIGGDVILGGGQIQITGGAIGGDVAIGGGVVRIESSVGGDISIGGGEIYINAPVAGSVKAHADKITLGPNAVISGNFAYTAPVAVVIEDGAVVHGETTYTERAQRATPAGIAAIFTIALLVKFLMTLACALVFALLFKRYFSELVRRVVANPLAEMGRGIVFLIVTPIASIILLATVIGIPLGALGLIAFAGALILGSLAAPVALGSVTDKWVFKRAEYRITWTTVLLGVALTTIVGLIPFVGALLKFLLLIATLGAMLHIKTSIAKEWR